MRILSKILILIAIYISIVIAKKNLRTLKELDHQFQKWSIKYNFKFSQSEEVYRKAIFLEKSKKIKELNKKHQDVTTFSHNQFSALTEQEFRETYLSKSRVQKRDEDFFSSFADTSTLGKNKNINSSILLQQTGPIDHSKWLLSARDQGSCGSDWSLSAATAIEGVISINQNQKIDYLSPQQLLDCDLSDNGCNGGSAFYSLTYIKNYGLMYERDYPYIAYQSICKYNKLKAVAKISSFEYCSNYSNSKRCSFLIIMDMLRRGPLLVGIDGYAIQSYDQGIFNDQCSEDNHQVLLVGYNVDQTTNQAYWIVRNTWSASWGESGYIKVAVNDSNQYSCYVANEGLLPKL